MEAKMIHPDFSITNHVAAQFEVLSAKYMKKLQR